MCILVLKKHVSIITFVKYQNIFQSFSHMTLLSPPNNSVIVERGGIMMRKLRYREVNDIQSDNTRQEPGPESRLALSIIPGPDHHVSLCQHLTPLQGESVPPTGLLRGEPPRPNFPPTEPVTSE